MKALISSCDDKEQSANQIYEQATKKCSLTEQKKRCLFHKRQQFSPRREDLSSQVYPGFNVKAVSMVSALLSASGWVIKPPYLTQD